MIRIAFIVSHPIQYYVPLYRLLAARADVQIRVFFTAHGAEESTFDHGFQRKVAWDIPLSDGYEFEVVSNVARDPGTHHFWGIRTPSLVRRVLEWRPDVVHVTGYAFASHLIALYSLRRHGIPVLFRGDSHLLDQRRAGWRWQVKRKLLTLVYQWPTAFLYVGQANRDYYRAFGVNDSQLFHSPHFIEAKRFAEPDQDLEEEAAQWRHELGIGPERRSILFAGKFEDKKRPVALMEAVRDIPDPRVLLIMVGDGKLGSDVNRIAASDPGRFRVLPFQNQTRMPVVYRLGDLLVLPSAYGETWGLAVNEALACGRPVLISDRVGCGEDVILPGENGDIFPADDWGAFTSKLMDMLALDCRSRRGGIRRYGATYSPERAADELLNAVHACTISQ